MQQGTIGCIVKLPATQTALQVEYPNPLIVGARIQRGHVAGNLGNPVAQVFAALGDNRMRILVSAVDGQPTVGRKRKVQSYAAAFDLAKILAHKQDWRRLRVDGHSRDGAVDLSKEVTGANRAPAPLG